MSPTSVLPVSIGYASFAESAATRFRVSGDTRPRPRDVAHGLQQRCTCRVTEGHNRQAPTSAQRCCPRCHGHAEIRPRTDTSHARRASLAQCTAAGQVQTRHHDAPLSTQLCSPVPVTTASRSRMLPLAVNYDPPAAIKLSFAATTRARSAVGPSLSLAQRSGTHCQTSSATHRYRLTVSVASLKHSCLQTRISIHSALEIFC